MAKLIYAEPDDEITNLVDRLRGEKEQADLVFVLPPSSRVMQSALNARLLMQYSNSLGKQTSVISPDPRTQGAAIETGFTVYPTLTDYEARRSIDRAIEAAPVYTPALDEFEPINGDAPPGPTPRRTEAPAPVPAPRARPVATRGTGVSEKRAGYLPWVLGGVGVLVIILILTFFVLPTATVTILTAARSVSATPTVTGSVTPAAGGDQLAVQTTVQQAQESTSQQRNSTGKKDVPAVPATGFVIFHNASPGSTILIPKNTEVYTDDGQKFVATTDASVGPNSDSGQLPIQAKVGGQAGNVPAGAIKNFTSNDPAARAVASVNNPQPTANGAEATSKVVVSQTDLDTAKRDLGDPLAQKVKDDLKAKASGQKIIDETQTVTVEANYDHKAGDEAGNFNANVTAKGQATSFDENKMKEVLTNAIKRQIPGGYQLTDDAPKFDYHVAQKDDKGMVIWDATASGFMAVAVNIDDLKKNVTGQSPTKARSYILGHIDASDVRISQVPSFVPWLPFLGARIDIKEQVQNNTPTQ